MIRLPEGPIVSITDKFLINDMFISHGPQFRQVGALMGGLKQASANQRPHLWTSGDQLTFMAKTYLTPWNTILLEKLIVAQLVNSPPFIQPEDFLPCSLELAIWLYPEAV
jgi:hypothetical protein